MLSVLGEAAYETGDLAAARGAYERALELRERMAAAEPGNLEWQRDLAVSLDRSAMLRQRPATLPRRAEHTSGRWNCATG